MVWELKLVNIEQDGHWLLKEKEKSYKYLFSSLLETLYHIHNTVNQRAFIGNVVTLEWRTEIGSNRFLPRLRADINDKTYLLILGRPVLESNKEPQQ